MLFGNTGGVMEAAVRTAAEVLTGNELPGLNLTAVRGLEGVKEATLDLTLAGEGGWGGKGVWPKGGGGGGKLQGANRMQVVTLIDTQGWCHDTQIIYRQKVAGGVHQGGCFRPSPP